MKLRNRNELRRAMNIRAKRIRIVFDNSSEDHWEAESQSGIGFDEAMLMIARAWERYDRPKEPLIENEKIRKAVRAWAEALDADEIRYNSCAEYSEGRFEAEMGMADIDFGRVIGLKDGNYTIAELCGEEEE